MTDAVYRYVCDVDAYDALTLANRAEYDLFDELEPLGERWQPPGADFYRVGREGDFPYLLSHVPVFSERAMGVLSPFLETSVEPLALRTPSGSYFAIHVLEPMECLDLERSEIEWLDEDRILFIDSYVFDGEKVRDRHMFRIVQQPFSFVYVSEAFRRAVEGSSLAGLTLEKVWG